MNPYKTFFIIVTLTCIVNACTSSSNSQYYQNIQGGWAIEIIEYNEEYLLGYNEKDSSKLYFAPNLYLYFDKGFYLIDKSRQEKTFYKGKIDIEMMDGEPTIIFTDSDKKELDGVYEFQIDTISSNHNFDELRLYLYSDSVFISAIKSKVKLFKNL